jgi:hypothetical protein
VNAPAEVLPGQLPLIPGRERTAAVLSALLSRSRGFLVDVDDEIASPELVRVRRRRRRSLRRARR